MEIYDYHLQIWEENARLERTVYSLQAWAAVIAIIAGLVVLAKNI